MNHVQSTIQGTVHGNAIEVEGALNLPEGQRVVITVQPLISPEDAIRRSAGGWSDDPDGVDQFVVEMRRLRDLDLPERGS
jgi:hypothetical protein